MHLHTRPTHILLFWLVLSYEKATCDLNVCPKYCRCYMWKGNIRRADCINQRLVNIETEVPQHVQALDLSNNSIAALENNGFKTLHFLQLKYINLQFNRISSIGLHAFAGLKDLQMVDLSYNHLHYLLPTTFRDTPALRTLFLSHNKLGKSTAGPLLDVPTLTELDISHCQLGVIHEEFFTQLSSLKKLNLSDNQLIRVEAHKLYPLKLLREVDLSNNPMSCDGITKELQQWLQKQLIVDTTICAREGKFAKIITAMTQNETEIEAMEDESHFWFDTDEKENQDASNISVTSADEPHTQNWFDAINRIPSFWAMLIGFQVGVVITMFGMYAWLSGPPMPKVGPVRFRRPRSLRIASHDNEVLWTELENEMPNCPETPPPPYHPYRSTTYDL